ncbi:uncharacterized protein LOC121906603 [Scomber scombrus]|uniref:Uncharacterized protein LOC121906603 n=1 Tax=Scomber scombrus TaxID=13677 RepID=A0AAV1PRC9_SCOSC
MDEDVMVKSLSDTQPQKGDVEPQTGMEYEHLMEPEKEKRVIKFTAKGLELFLANTQKARNSKCKQTKVLMETMKELMQSNENANKIRGHLDEMDRLCEEACEYQKSLKSFLPENELEKQTQWLNQNMDKCTAFGQGQTANRATTPVTLVKLASDQSSVQPDNIVGLTSTSLTSVKATSETVTADINLSAKGSMTTAVETPLNVTSGDNNTGQTVNRASTPVTPVKSASGQTAFRPDTTVGLMSTSLSSVKTTSETVTADINLSAKGSMTTAVETPLNVTSGDNNTDEYVPMRNIDHVERKIQYFNVNGSEKPKGSELQNHDDTYHMYATISEEPAASAVNSMVYSTVQPH